MATNNNSFAKATNLGVLSGFKTRTENLNTSPTADFQFRLKRRSNFSSLLSGLQNNADLLLFESLSRNRRRKIAASTKSGTTDEAINKELRSGTYYIRVKSKQKNSTRYQLQLAAISADPTNIDGQVIIEPIIPLIPGTNPTTVVGSVGGGNNNDFLNSDYYIFDTRSLSNLSARLGGLTSTAEIRVLDARGNQIAVSAPRGLESRNLNVNLAPGTYYLQVRTFNNAQTNYSLTTTLINSPLIGLRNDNSLLAFTPTNTTAVNLPIRGLSTGENLLDIDFRPPTNQLSNTSQLYGLSNQGRLYTLNLSNGVATQVGNSNTRISLIGSQFAIDFDPQSGFLQVVSDRGQNLRVDPNTGTALNPDPRLAYAATDPNRTETPSIARIAYSNNRINANRTTLYGIDTSLNNLVTQGSPAGTPTSPTTGQLFTIGSTGSNAGASLVGNGGFDIFTDATGTDFAYATTGAGLFTVSLATGTTTLANTINVGGGLVSTIGIAASPIDF